jgi:hypothetical protein
LENLKRLGADTVINYKAVPDWGRKAKDLTDGRGVDHVIEVGGPGTLTQSITACRTGGNIAPLRPFVSSFLIVEFPPFHRDAHLPSTGPVAAFSFGGACRIDGAGWAPSASFTASWQTMRTYEHCHTHRGGSSGVGG